MQGPNPAVADNRDSKQRLNPATPKSRDSKPLERSFETNSSSLRTSFFCQVGNLFRSCIGGAIYRTLRAPTPTYEAADLLKIMAEKEGSYTKWG